MLKNAENCYFNYSFWLYFVEITAFIDIDMYFSHGIDDQGAGV